MTSPADPAPVGASDVDRLHSYVEMWKQAVAVQQHFNEICWKIRGLALTALTFTLGAASLTASAEDRPAALVVKGFSIDTSALTVCVGLLVWLAFFFVDASWYHRLLTGAVAHGVALEKELQHTLPAAGLTIAIGAASPSPLPLTQKKMHSKHKLWTFYGVIAVLLVVLAVVLQGTAGAPPAAS